MSRKVYDFKSYNDFFGTKVTKQTLASLCASLREILDVYSAEDEKLKKTLLDKGSSYEAKVDAIVEAREDRKTKMLAIVQKVLEKRNTNFTGNDVIKAVSVCDVFKNLHENVDEEGGLTDNYEEIILKLNTEIEDFKTKVASANETILELERKIGQQVESASTLYGHTTLESVNTTSSTSSFKGAYKLDAKTPVFHSRIDEDVDKWLIRIEASLTFANVPQSLWITATYNYVEGIALEMVIAAKKDNQTWDSFKERMIETFRPVNKKYDLRARLLKLKDVDNFDKYLHDFRTLENQIPLEELSKIDRFTCFMSGLRSKTRGEILRLGVKTLEEAIKTANQLNAERNQDKGLSGQLNYLKVQKKGFKKPIGSSDRSNIVCHRCNRKGHMKKDCRVKLDGVGTQKPVVKPPSTSGQVFPKITCRLCHRKGHYASACKSAKKPASSNLVEVAVCMVESSDNEMHVNDIGIPESELVEMAETFKELSKSPDDNFSKLWAKCQVILANRKLADLRRKREMEIIRRDCDDDTSRFSRGYPDDDSVGTLVDVCAGSSASSKSLWEIQGALKIRQNDARLLDFSCVIDTGASVSIISSKIVTQWGIPFSSTNLQVRQADGNVVDVMGITNEMEIHVLESAIKIKFLIMNNAKHDVLLGLDWMHASNCVLHPSSQKIRFVTSREDYLLTSGLKSVDDGSQIQIDCEDDLELGEMALENDDDYWELGKDSNITPQATLSKGEYREFSKLAKELEVYIAKDISQLGKCTILKHTINLVDNTPVFIPAYRKSQFEREEMKKQINEMLEAGIIRKSKSPFQSPSLMIRKPNGTWRFCVDYRNLNKKTVQQNFPIPRILDILDKLNGSKFFTTLDLKSGYWQVEMEEASIPRTAFGTQDGHYEFLRLPFGLKNAPADFSRMMYMVLGDLTFVEIYLDDITIHSKSFVEHLNHIRIVMERLAEANLKINHEKCTWCSSVVKILGHVVSHNKIQMDPKKVASIKDWKFPQNVKQIQQFLGLANYYKRFVKDFSKIAGPLFNLLKKETPFVFDEACKKAFENLKEVLTSDPILRPPDFSKEFILYTDASGYCLGLILGQKTDDNKEYVVAYGSRMLKGAELHYSITEKEALAVIFAVIHFRVYLYGKKFTIITDHAALKWLMSITDFKSTTERLARWAIRLQCFEFDIIHRAGRIHSNVDVLSRPIMNINVIDNTLNSNDDSIEKSLDVFENEPLLFYIKNGRHLPGASSNTVRRVYKLSKNYRFNGKDITFKLKKWNKARIVPPIEDRSKIIWENHLIGHFATRSTFDRIFEKYFWKKMLSQINNVLKQCETCARNKTELELNHPALALKVTGLFDRIGIDLVFGLPESAEGYIGIMVITESLSKYPWAKPIRSKTAKEIAEVLKEYICIFGAPKTIVSDNGTEFNNELVDTMLKNIGVEHRVTSSYNPRANGLTERTNQSIITALRKHVETDQLSWPKWLDWVLFAYRTRVHSSTNFTPFEVLFGRKANSFSDWRSLPDVSKTLELEVRSNEIKNLFESTIPKVKSNIAKNQDLQKNAQDKSKNILKETLKVGTRVMIKNTDKLVKKLENRYRGPYTVIGVTKDNNYILEDVLKQKLEATYPLHKLKVTALDDATKSDYAEIEKIVSHKLENNKPLYLVKWRNEDSKNNSWVRPEDFANMKFVNDYLKSIEEGRSTRSKKALSAATILSVISILFLFFPLIYGNELRVNDKFDFDYCSVSNDLMPLNLNDLCTRPTEIDTNHLQNWFKKYYILHNHTFPKPNISTVKIDSKFKNMYRFDAGILSKSINTVYGKAFQCKKIIFTRSWSVGFWGKEYRNDDIRIDKLDADSCWYLVNNKKCVFGNFVNDMKCDENNNCNYEGFPLDEYSWFRDSTKSFAHCYVTSRFIAEADLNSHIFNGFCKISDWFCNLKDSIVVWHRDIVHSCPFRRVSNGNLRSNGVYFVEDSQKLGFQFKRFETQCGVDMIYTTEGLYVAPLTVELKDLEKYEDFSDTRGTLDLVLADEDFK